MSVDTSERRGEMTLDERPWQEIAADMIEARHVSIGDVSTDAEVAAAAFVFDNGIFYLGDDGMAEVVATLRALKHKEAGR